MTTIHSIDPIVSQKVYSGRSAVDAYRLTHQQLQPPNMPEKHTPFLEKMLNDLSIQGFKSIDEFFTASDELNIKELGFKDRLDFNTKAKQRDINALDGMWH